MSATSAHSGTDMAKFRGDLAPVERNKRVWSPVSVAVECWWSGLVQATVFFTFAPWGSYCVKYQCRWHLCLLDFLDSVTEITEGIVNSSQSRMAMCKRTINPRSYFRVSPL